MKHQTMTAATAAQQVDGEHAWLIEAVDARWGTGYFWRGIAEYERWGTIDKAVRFSRKDDAQQVIDSLQKHERRFGGTAGKYEACEHVWPLAAPVSEERNAGERADRVGIPKEPDQSGTSVSPAPSPAREQARTAEFIASCEARHLSIWDALTEIQTFARTLDRELSEATHDLKHDAMVICELNRSLTTEREARREAERERDDANEETRDLNTALVQVRDKTYQPPAKGWQCFHCGEWFTTEGAARHHFGNNPEHIKEVRRQLANALKERDQQERFKWAANTRADSSEQRAERAERERNELQARIDAASKRCGDGKALHTRYMDGRLNDTKGVIDDMEHIFYSIRCYLEGARGAYRLAAPTQESGKGGEG